jgi:hypothetical protein
MSSLRLPLASQAAKQPRVSPLRSVIADRDAERLLLPDQHEQPLAPRDPRINQVALQEHVVLRGERDHHLKQKEWRKHHHGTTNYATFLREIERWRSEFNEKVCLVTFNYDTMLEDAAHQVLRLDLQSLPSYITCPDYKVIKPHGSVNWGREVDGIKSTLGVNHQRLINEITDLRISDRYRVVAEWPMLKVENAFVFPALSIPIEKKISSRAHRNISRHAQKPFQKLRR